jgi:predicted phosphohydrolase
MKFQISSDIHLDHITFYNPATYIIPSADILILAGDICHSCTMYKHKKFFSYINNSFKKIIFIPGNHEFYNNDFITLEESEKNMKNFLSEYKNIVYLNNDFIRIDNYLLAGSTFWFKPDVINTWFRIPNITTKNVSDMNEKSINFFKYVKKQKIHDETVIFISHYPKLLYKKEKDINSTIQSEKTEDESDTDNENLIEYYDAFSTYDLPSIWISGHTHKNKIEEINETVFISNQRKGINYSNSFVLNID